MPPLNIGGQFSFASFGPIGTSRVLKNFVSTNGNNLVGEVDITQG